MATTFGRMATAFGRMTKWVNAPAANMIVKTAATAVNLSRSELSRQNAIGDVPSRRSAANRGLRWILADQPEFQFAVREFISKDVIARSSASACTCRWPMKSWSKE
jgi:hypothetical protein